MHQPTDESASDTTSAQCYPNTALLAADACDKTRASYAKQMLLSAGFFAIFLVLEMASKTAQGWPGAPAFYLPLGLVIALFLWGGLGYWPLVFVSALIGAAVNYHRPLMSWCGIPGIVGVYCSYVGGIDRSKMVAHRSTSGDGQRRRAPCFDFSHLRDSYRSHRNVDAARRRAHFTF